MSELAYKVFEPKDGRTDELLVIGNEIGASLEDYLEQEAEFLVRELGMRVLAFERSGSASDELSYLQAYSLRRELRKDPTHNTLQTAILLASAIEKEEKQAGIHLAGHSAAATEAIMLTDAEKFAVDSLTVTDPPGVHYHIPIIGELHYINYSTRKDPGNQMQGEPFKGQPDSDAMRNRKIRELLAFSGLWRSTVALNSLIRIGEEMTDTKVSATFPEYTFNASTKELIFMVGELSELREDDSFKAILESGAYHSSYSLLHKFAGIVRENVN